MVTDAIEPKAWAPAPQQTGSVRSITAEKVMGWIDSSNVTVHAEQT